MRKAQSASFAGTLLLVIGVWWLCHSLGVAGIPSFLSVLETMVSRQFLARFAAAAWSTGMTVLMALAFGGLTGFYLGLLLARAPDMLSGPYHALNGLKTTPVTVLIPFFLAVFGLRRFLVPLLVLPVLAITAVNVADAAKNVSATRAQYLLLAGIKPKFYRRHVLQKEMQEPVFATLRIVIPLAFAIEIAVDFFLNINGGLGTLIAEAYHYPGRDTEMYAAIVGAAILGSACVVVVDLLSEKGLRWKRDM